MKRRCNLSASWMKRRCNLSASWMKIWQPLSSKMKWGCLDPLWSLMPSNWVEANYPVYNPWTVVGGLWGMASFLTELVL
jgi:hypothetical protein